MCTKTCGCAKVANFTINFVQPHEAHSFQLGQTEVALVAAGGQIKVGGYLLTEGVWTGDGRRIAAEALRWDTPLPLRRVREDFGAHTGAVTVGAITEIEREEDGRIRWAGVIFNTADGLAAASEMRERFDAAGLRYGISVDLDDPEVEVEEDEERAMVRMTVLQARLRGATLCDIPAFADAYGSLDETEAEDDEAQDIEEDVDDDLPVLTAAAVRLAPAAWYANPQLDGPSALTVTPDGRIFGHMALWDTCHVGFPGMCVTPPHSRTGYSYFHTGLVRTSDGQEVAVGHITMDTGHASTRLSARDTVAHYDNTGTIVADIAVGEDEHGVWVAGAVRSGISADKIDEIQAAAVSGDWREIKGSLELVALLSVVSPGFPIPRARALAASGMMKALIATSFHQEAPVDEPIELPLAPTAATVAALADGTVEQGDLAPEEEPETEESENEAEPETEEPPAEESAEESAEAEDATISLPDGDEGEAPVIEDAPAEESPEDEDDTEEESEEAEALAPVTKDNSELLKQLDSLAGVETVSDELLAQLDQLAGV